MEACEEIDRTLGEGAAICKNLFLCNRQETEFYLLLIPGEKPFKNKVSVCPDRVLPSVFWQTGIYGEVSGYYTGIRERAGADE